MLAAKRTLQTQPRRVLSAEVLLASGAWMQRNGRLVNARQLAHQQRLQQLQRAQQRQLLRVKSIIVTNCFFGTPKSTNPIPNLGFREDVDGWHESSHRSRNQNSTSPNSRSSSSQSRPQVLKGAGVLANFTKAWPWIRSKPADSCGSECLVLTTPHCSQASHGGSLFPAVPSEMQRSCNAVCSP